MRIAQVAPLYESVPPRLYGGTERIVSFLTEELVARGHDVTLFASGESQTSAELAAVRATAMRLDPDSRPSPTAAHLAMLHTVAEKQSRFDIIHVHLSHFLHFPLLAPFAAKTLTTPHGRLDYDDLAAAYACWPNFPMVSISDRQRRPLPMAQWVGTVHHGLPLELLTPQPKADGEPYLAFLGRLSRDKRPDRAIDIAERCGLNLRMAAKIDPDDRAYFHEKVEGRVDGTRIAYVGEVNEAEKVPFLCNAEALLFPIDWPEPFGLVVIEAMALGVPTVAWRQGAMAEIIDEGVTGFVVDSIDEAVEAVGKARRLDRLRIRAMFEERFSVRRMVDDYESIYMRLSATRPIQPAPA